MRFKHDRSMMRWYYWSGIPRRRGTTRWAPLPWGVKPTDVMRDGLQAALKKSR